MREFKAGDKVRRIGYSTQYLRQGDVYTVESVTKSNVFLIGYDHAYDKTYFELVESDDSELIEIL